VLVLHGTEDRILPFESTAKRLPDLVANLTLIPSKASAQHRLDAPGRMQHGAARLHPNGYPHSAVEDATRTA
jgi:hypothetical protein